MVEVPGSVTQAGAEMEGSPLTSVEEELPPEDGGKSESGGIRIRRN